MATTLHWPVRDLPRTFRAGRFPLEDRHFAYRYRSPTIALHIYDYDGAVRIGRRQFSLRPGDLTLTPANTDSRYDLPRPGHHWCIHFSRPITRVLARQRRTVSLPLHLHLGAAFPHAVQQVLGIATLLARGRAGSAAAEAAADVQTQNLLLWLAMLVESRASHHPIRSEQAIDRVVQIVNERFAEPLTVPDLAEEVGLSQNYLASRFRARLAMTLPRYLITRRIDHARQLLHTTDMPIQAIARRVGMPDPQHFNKQFRRLCGQSPTRWREESRLSVS